MVLVTFGSSVHNAKIMLGMLVKVLRGDSIATRRRLEREGNVTFEVMRATSNFDVRTVTIEGLTSVRHLLPITVGIITVMATMRSAGLSWSHDTCRIDGEIGSLSNESMSEPLLAEAEVSHRFSIPAQSSLAPHPRWHRLYLQQVFGAMPTEAVSSAPRSRGDGGASAGQPHFLLNTLAAITCKEVGFRSLGEASADTMTGPERTVCYQAPIYPRGGAACASGITRVRHSRSGMERRSTYLWRPAQNRVL